MSRCDSTLLYLFFYCMSVDVVPKSKHQVGPFAFVSVSMPTSNRQHIHKPTNSRFRILAKHHDHPTQTHLPNPNTTSPTNQTNKPHAGSEGVVVSGRRRRVVHRRGAGRDIPASGRVQGASDLAVQRNDSWPRRQHRGALLLARREETGNGFG
jgi:hypothetical protein